MKKSKDTELRDLRDVVIIVVAILVAILLIATMIHYDKDRGLHLGLPVIIEHSTYGANADTSEANATNANTQNTNTPPKR